MSGGRRHMRAEDHRLLHRIVEGAVRDALSTHPEYLTSAGQAWAVQSITKRVTGQLVGYHKGTQAGGRHAASCAGARDTPRGSQRGAAGAAPRNPGKGWWARLWSRIRRAAHVRRG